jgi:hypothetical protein
MARRKSARSNPAKRLAKNPDAALIHLCCMIVADFAAFSVAFAADQDGNHAGAQKLSTSYIDRAHKNCRKAVAIEAVTVYGLSAKAKAAEAAFRDDIELGEALLESTKALITSLIADTIRLARECADKERAVKRVTSSSPLPDGESAVTEGRAS